MIRTMTDETLMIRTTTDETLITRTTIDEKADNKDSDWRKG